MARINIDDSLYQDRRYEKLLLKLGDSDRAIGALVRAWSLAQKWYLSPEKMIPITEWNEQEIRNEILEVGFAEVIDGKVKMRGADEQFAWLTQRKESGAKGGVAKREKSSSRNDSGIPLPTATDRSIPLPTASETYPPTLPPPPTLPLSLKEENKEKEKTKSTDGAQKPPLSAGCWDAYSKAYEKRYRTMPVRNQSVNAMLCGLVRKLGEDDAPLVAEFYVFHNDRFYVNAMHPVNLLTRDAEKLRTEWFTGNRITGGKAREIERKQENLDVFSRLLTKYDTQGE